MSIVKNRLGVIVGAVTAMALIGVMEIIIDKNFPHPVIDMKNNAAVAEMIRTMPINFSIALLINYIIASFAGGLVATLVSGRHTNNPAFVTGLLLMLAGIANLVMIHHPLWFAVVSSLIYIPFSFLGYMIAKKNIINPDA